jgi:site-specific DNA-methyltransferase (adenine-specific)
MSNAKEHPAPFPLELAYRLVRMFSFYGDTVLDPFCGTGTTMLAAAKTGRNSIGIEIDPAYCRMAERRLERETRSLFGQATVTLEEPAAHARPAVEATQPLTVSDAPRRRRRGKRE